MRVHIPIAVFFLWMPALLSADPVPLQQQYLDVYLKINDAEHLERRGDYSNAAKVFQDCFDRLGAIHQAAPDWESSLVLHRMEDCRTKIIELDGKIGDLAPVAGSAPSSAPAAPAPSLILPEKSHVSYPWKKDITAALFWIGEDGSKGSAWDPNWTKTNGGADAPDSRNGFVSADHAGRVNPFYIALPFNDLTFPDKAKDWVPHSWRRAPEEGKTVSACKDRWVWIKNSMGRSCFAQWEDVGPSGNDDAEYVFGSEPPKAKGKPGISLSPAVAQYLGIGDANDPGVVAWKFVDEQDVPPGQWLKYDEQALIFAAMHHLPPSGGK